MEKSLNLVFFFSLNFVFLWRMAFCTTTDFQTNNWAEMGGGREKQQLGGGHASGTANAARPRRTTKMKNSS